MEEGVIEKKEGEILITGETEEGKEKTEEAEREKKPSENELAELREKHLRLYAEFENYKRRVQREKEDLIRYSNEEILFNLLPVIDNLEMALKHSADSLSENLIKGVENTLREFQRVLEKFGLAPIQALGEPFDPSVHHAMSVMERADVEDKTVVEEFRKGYMFGEKVLRPSLVAVSRKPDTETETEEEIKEETKEE